MHALTLCALVLSAFELAYCVHPEVSCPAPISPDHGQAFLYQEGSVVKYVCEPGYALKGKAIVRCIEGQWEEPNPMCLENRGDGIKEVSENIVSDSDVLAPPDRPLFSWGPDYEHENSSQDKTNETAEELPLSDEARVKLLMYPRRRVVTRVQTAKLHSATELEEEEKRRSQDKFDSSSTTIHLEAPPSLVYVRRTVIPGKSEASRRALDEAASLHMTVENEDDVQMISLPRAAVSMNDKGYQTDQMLRQLYWYAHHYPRQASLIEYRNGVPVVMTLTESQLAWINSLHPELRDQYLRDLYVMRAEESIDGERAQAFLRRYENAHNYYYGLPYLRRPVSLIVDNVAATYDYTCNQAGSNVVSAPSLPNMHIARYDSRKNIHAPHNYYLAAVYQCDPVIVEDPISNYDYSCHESGYPFVKAPKLRNMHVQRYDRRQNPNNPHNHYLAAVYRCNPGYIMIDTRYTELYCSKKDWIGAKPVCVRRG